MIWILRVLVLISGVYVISDGARSSNLRTIIVGAVLLLVSIAMDGLERKDQK